MDSLQFQKAEFAGGERTCDACKGELLGEYYKLYSGQENISASHTICAACAVKVEAEQASPSHAALVRGVLYGAGMTLACCAGSAAVIMISGLEIGLVSILVGYLVGRAVKQGAQGRGARRLQVVAVGLTYLSITFSYIPVGIQQYRKQKADIKAQVEKAASGEVVTRVPPVNFVMTLALLSGLAVVSPFLNLQEGIGGLLGIFILFLGLQRAWAMTGRDPRQVTGPFQQEATVG